MQKNEAAVERNRSLFMNIVVMLVLLGLIVFFMRYLTGNSADVKRLSMATLAESYRASINHIHWQWQAEGRPEIIKFKSYSNQLADDKELVEIKQQPILMSDRGWPKVEESLVGCENVWYLILGAPTEAEGLNVVVNFYDGEKLTGDRLDSTCRYSLSLGSYFEYKIHLGRVLQMKNII